MLSLVWKDFYINRSQLVFPAIVLCAIALLAAVGDRPRPQWITQFPCCSHTPA